MYLMNLNDDFLIEGVSTRFKKLMSKQCGSLKNCFFLSMLDSEVPDQLALDLETTLKRGIIYNTSLKLNVLEKPAWFDVSIVRRFEDGYPVGYRVKFEAASQKDLKMRKNIFRKIKEGELALHHGIPVRGNFDDHNENDEDKMWSTRIK